MKAGDTGRATSALTKAVMMKYLRQLRVSATAIGRVERRTEARVNAHVNVVEGTECCSRCALVTRTKTSSVLSGERFHADVGGWEAVLL